MPTGFNLRQAQAFGINLAPGSLSFPKLGIAIMRAYVRGLQAIDKRNAGESIETPTFVLASSHSIQGGGTLREAIDGWKRQRTRPARTVHEFS